VSNQQGMFYPQDQEPRERENQRNANTDPREQSDAQPQQQWNEPVAEAYTGYERGYADYEQGYDGNKAREQEKVRPQEAQSQSFLGGTGLQTKQIILIVIAILILSSIFSAMQSSGIFGLFISMALLALAGYFLIFRQGLPSVALPPQLFTVQEHSHLNVKNPAGSITVVHGEGKTIEVAGKQISNGGLSSPLNTRVVARQEGDTVSVEATQTSWFPSRVDLVITVPTGCDLQINGNAGTIDIDGIDGEAVVTTNAGTIKMRNTKLRGRSKLMTNAGTIDFSGTLDPSATGRLETNIGTINATISRDASFVIEAKTDLGTVHNDFGNNVVGTAPFAKLELYTNMGTVTVRRG
jgi:hypothetical protein